MMTTHAIRFPPAPFFTGAGPCGTPFTDDTGSGKNQRRHLTEQDMVPGQAAEADERLPGFPVAAGGELAKHADSIALGIGNH